MRKLQWVLSGSFVCVCCVLPSYEGSDTNPRGSDAGSSGDAGRGGSSTDGGSSNVAGASTTPQGGVPVGEGGDGGTAAGVESGGATSQAGENNGGTSTAAGTGNGGGGTTNGGAGSGGTGGTGGTGGSGGGGPEGPCPANVVGHCDRDAVYPAYAGYTLALVEDFPVALDLDNDPVFTWSDAAPPDGQTGFRKEGLSFEAGKLVITASKPPGCSVLSNDCIAARPSYGEAISPNKTASVPAEGVWSGELRSRYNNYRYGRYEVKMAAPVANPGQQNNDSMSGNFLTMMYAYRTPRNVQWAEIDLILQADQHAKVNTNIVSATGAVGYPNGNASPATATPATGYTIYDEHVYAFEWKSSGIAWYLDGQPIHSFSGSAQVPIPSVSVKIMLSLWVFSSNVAFGDPALNKFPFSAKYDYFRFYRLNTETTYPCSPAPACLPAADKTQSAQNNPSEPNYGQ